MRDRVRTAVEVVAPQLGAWQKHRELPLGEILASLAETGVLGLGFPEQWGGIGGGLHESVVFHEELARLGCAAVSTAVLGHLEVATRAVIELAAPEVAHRWVPAALGGKAVLGYALTEPGAGSDIGSTTTAARRHDGGWVLDGVKRFITNGRQAHALCVLARTSEHALTSHTMFLVPTDAAGMSTEALPTLGNRGTLAEVRLDHVVVADDARLGLEGEGRLLQIPRLTHERAFVAVVLSTLAAQCAPPHAPELFADVEEARCLARHAVTTLVAGADARVAAAIAKLTAGRVYKRAALAAAMRDVAAVAAYEDALAFAFAGGTENMLLETIAR